MYFSCIYLKCFHISKFHKISIFTNHSWNSLQQHFCSSSIFLASFYFSFSIILATLCTCICVWISKNIIYDIESWFIILINFNVHISFSESLWFVSPNKLNIVFWYWILIFNIFLRKIIKIITLARNLDFQLVPFAKWWLRDNLVPACI